MKMEERDSLDVIQELIANHYRIKYLQLVDGTTTPEEGFVIHPDGTVYQVSLNGANFTKGCNCQSVTYCKHLAAFMNIRPCPKDGCMGVRIKRKVEGLAEIFYDRIFVWNCISCGYSDPERGPKVGHLVAECS